MQTVAPGSAIPVDTRVVSVITALWSAGISTQSPWQYDNGDEIAAIEMPTASADMLTLMLARIGWAEPVTFEPLKGIGQYRLTGETFEVVDKRYQVLTFPRDCAERLSRAIRDCVNLYPIVA